MPVEIAIIIPVFNEAENVLPLVQEVTAAFASAKQPYELILVDDASTDATWQHIQQATKADPRVRGLRHQQNAGQSAAVWTGILHSDSAIIATLDGDRQNDPADLPNMLPELAGYDFVAGVRANRNDSAIRKISSRIARWARRTVLGVDFRDTGCATRVFRRTALEGVFPFNGWHRFLPVLVHNAGCKVKEVPVNHRPRVAGVSKYGVWNRVWRGLADLFGLAWLNRRRLNRVKIETT